MLGASGLARRGVALLLWQHPSVQLATLSEELLVHILLKWCSYLLEPCELWCAELQPGLCPGWALQGGACEPRFLLPDVRSGTGCGEVRVACPDGRVWWKCLLSRHPLPLWHGWFRAQPLPDSSLERPRCRVAQMRRQDVGLLQEQGEQRRGFPVIVAVYTERLQPPPSQPPPRDPRSAMARVSRPPLCPP